MKKVFSYILLLFACVLTFSVSVYAEEKYSCSYDVQFDDTSFFYIKAVVNTDGTSDILYKKDSTDWASTSAYKLKKTPIFYRKGDTYFSEKTNLFSVNSLTVESFQTSMSSSDLNTDCPVINSSVVEGPYFNTYSFYFSDKGGTGFTKYTAEGKLSGSKGSVSSSLTVTTDCPYTLTASSSDGTDNVTLYTSFRMKSDGSKLVCAVADSKNIDSSCQSYVSGNYAHLISVNGKSYSLVLYADDLTDIFRQNSDQKSKNVYSCPSKMKMFYNSLDEASGGARSLVLTPNDNPAYPSSGNSSNSSESGSSNAGSNNSNSSDEHIGDNFCENSNILSVLRMVGYALTLLKVFVPIIIIIWATLKFYQAVTAGSSEALSKQVKSLLYRVGIGVMVFFVPTLIDAVLVNFIPADSKKCEICVLKPFSCNPGDPSSIDTSDPTTITKWTDPKCESRNGSQRYCENKSGCKWNKSENKCEYAKAADSCANKCSAYDSTSDAYFHCIDGCLLTSPSSVTTPTEAKCEHRRESQTMCESASGCYWDEYEEEGNRCKYKNSGGSN